MLKEDTASRLWASEESTRATTTVIAPGTKYFHTATMVQHQSMASQGSRRDVTTTSFGHVCLTHDLEALGFSSAFPSRGEGGGSVRQPLSVLKWCWTRRANMLSTKQRCEWSVCFIS